jgi:uncharacterized membrane protein YedE/YeeE
MYRFSDILSIENSTSSLTLYKAKNEKALTNLVPYLAKHFVVLLPKLVVLRLHLCDLIFVLLGIGLILEHVLDSIGLLRGEFGLETVELGHHLLDLLLLAGLAFGLGGWLGGGHRGVREADGVRGEVVRV